MTRNKNLCYLCYLWLTLLISSCSMMTEDRSNCPDCHNLLHVVLRYDYNMQHANMFNDQVQAVTCYLADAQTNRIVDIQEVWNTTENQPLKHTSFAFNFENLDAGDYRAVALATAPATPGPGQYIRNLTIGDDITALGIRFPRNPGSNSSTGRYAVPAEPLDTLWHAIGKTVHVAEQTPAFDTLSLVRDTKNLSIMLMQTQNPTECRADNYEVRILDSNGRLDYQNQPLPDDPLTYSPYAAWTTETLASTAATRSVPSGLAAVESVTARTAHYDLSFARLIAHETSADNARLQVINRQDGTTILDIDLVYYLALARNASARNYSIQEFLDREHDYSLDILLDGNEWRYMTLSISVMSWSLRIQNEEL